MVMRKVFVRDRDAIPEVSRIMGVSEIELDYEFGKAELWKRICFIEADLTAEQLAEIDRSARRRIDSDRTRVQVP